MTHPAAVWILSRSRRGDLGQMIDLAEAVGAPYAIKKIPDASDADAAPWPPFGDETPPRVVLSAERSVTGIALALKTGGAGRTKAVSIGRPGERIDEFDLVVTSPHFRVRAAPNVLELATPLHRLDRAAMQAAAEVLKDDVERLPRPFTVALIGGTSSPDMLNGAAAAALAAELRERVRWTGGSLLLATSPRTSREAVAALSEGTKGVGKAYLWRPDMPFNPYQGLLELADEFVTTSDSASMPIEAALTGKPVFLYRLPRRRKLRHVAEEVAERCRTWIPPLEAMFQRGAIEVRADRRLLFDPLERRGVLRTFSPEARIWVPAPLESAVEQAAVAVRKLLSPS